MILSRVHVFLSPDESNSAKFKDENDRTDEYEGEEEYADDDGYVDEDSQDQNAQSPVNQVFVHVSYSLMSQLKQMARMEGVTLDDIVSELLAEGVTRRAFEDANRPAPSHLMTRTGYVPPEANGNLMQPSMSHHSFNQQGGNRRGQQNNQRRGNGNFKNNYNNNGGGNFRYGNQKKHHNNNRGHYNQNNQWRDNGNSQGQQQQQDGPAPQQGNKDEKK